MSATAPSPSALRVADLPQYAKTPFEVSLGSDATKALAEELNLDGLRKLRFVGHIAASGAHDWQLRAKLGATVVQPCGVTLEPVTTRIDTDVARLYQCDFEEPDAPETEMPEDDDVEALGPWIDPHAVMVEALSLAIPAFPRADGAALGETVATEPGAQALRDDDLKPFAGLAGLKARLEQDDEGE